MASPSTVILLAGGASNRMGTPKGLLDYSGRPWILEQVQRIERSGIPRLVIVLGYKADQYISAIPILSQAHQDQATHNPAVHKTTEVKSSLTVVVNDQPEFGLFSSIQIGVKTALTKVTPDPHPTYILPVDVPAPKPSAWSALSERFHQRSRINDPHPAQVIVPTFCGRRGHPVLISPEFQELIMKVPYDAPEARLDFQIRSIPPELIQEVEVNDPQIRMNLNTPQDWKRFREA